MPAIATVQPAAVSQVLRPYAGSACARSTSRLRKVNRLPFTRRSISLASSVPLAVRMYSGETICLLNQRLAASSSPQCLVRSIIQRGSSRKCISGGRNVCLGMAKPLVCQPLSTARSAIPRNVDSPVWPNHSIERTAQSLLRSLWSAAHVERLAPWRASA
jgi:hypothetical protein